MPKKATTAPKTKKAMDPKDAVVDAALELSAALGWANVTLCDIADKAGMDMATLFDLVDDKMDVLCLFGRRIDRQVLENIGTPDESLSARDRLFDILMERFDVLNEYRDGLIPILESFKFDPKQAVISMPYLCKSMSWMLEASGIETGGIRGALKVAGLTGVYLKTLRVWRDDDTPDMGQVMAALDKDLGRAEQLASTFGF